MFLLHLRKREIRLFAMALTVAGSWASGLAFFLVLSAFTQLPFSPLLSWILSLAVLLFLLKKHA
jgi:hypothetical protein